MELKHDPVQGRVPKPKFQKLCTILFWIPSYVSKSFVTSQPWPISAHTHVQTHARTHIHARTRAHTHACAHTHTHTHTYAHTRSWACTHANARPCKTLLIVFLSLSIWRGVGPLNRWQSTARWPNPPQPKHRPSCINKIRRCLFLCWTPHIRTRPFQLTKFKRPFEEETECPLANNYLWKVQPARIASCGVFGWALQECPSGSSLG